MRTFIAIELPQKIKDALERLQNQLKTTGADVKWVSPQNIHLTLKFLGEIDDKKIGEATKILEDNAKNEKTFPLRLASIGAFPKIDTPRVIWIGVAQGDSETKKIAGSLEDAFSKIGIPKEDRPFSSHITIGRVRSPQNRDKLVQELKTLADSSGKENLEFTADKITLFKSTLTPKGPLYEAFKIATLQTT
ncbi:MAG: RNA 2',3'-cyclic phosphodiesterase [Candidatus Omnitrophica bacterium]|nr:RNA 2',3'-cyclic phosphodiesterase [Candidatus Omnitrophota bacterium]